MCGADGTGKERAYRFVGGTQGCGAGPPKDVQGRQVILLRPLRLEARPELLAHSWFR